MARRPRRDGGGGAPDWLVTFADLMSLLVCFFVLIISFSIQDKEKLQVVAGSMREAFGVRADSRKSGMIEIEGTPVRDYARRVAAVERDTDTDFSEIRHDERRSQGPEANTHDIEMAEIEIARQFATAAASLRQAWQEMPEIAELSKNIIMTETEEGLNIQLVDQDGQAMFAEGSKFPEETARKLIRAMAPVVRDMPNRVSITGHTTASSSLSTSYYTTWELSADRANAVRGLLAENGIRNDRFHSVTGKSDQDPLFPNDPFLAANRRVSILLMAEKPPLPPGFKP
jgi:chemotaxis protein MotB